MGLQIEFEYEDSTDGVWSQPDPAEDSRPAREWLSWGRTAGRSGAPTGSPLFLHLGIALAAFAVGAASMAGFMTGRTAVNDRSVALLHLAPLNSFVVQALPEPIPMVNQAPDQLLAQPWTNTFDRDVTLTVINDGPAPVTVLGATVSSLDFDVTGLTPATTAPTTPGGVSVLRGLAHFVCGDFPVGRNATIANLRARTADGAIRQETLMVDRFSEVAEQAVCARMPSPQIMRAITFSPATDSPAVRTQAETGTKTTYIANVTVSNRAPFPLRMSVPSSAIQSWTSDAGLLLTADGDTIIPPRGTGAIAIAVAVTDCSSAELAASERYDYDALSFSDGRDPADDPHTRSIVAGTVGITDLDAIMKYCIAKSNGAWASESVVK